MCASGPDENDDGVPIRPQVSLEKGRVLGGRGRRGLLLVEIL